MKMLKTWSAVLLLLIFFTACNDDDAVKGTGKANIYITDAPIDDANVSAVIISINRVEANGPNGWETVEEFEEPVSLDLLSYQNGEVYLLTEETVDAGAYSEVRLLLNIQEQIDGQLQNPGSYIEYKDGTIEPLYVPSGGQSGYKAKGDFTIPVDGVVSVTLDFDVRKAIVQSGNSGKFILKPTIRLVANQDAGTIEGSFVGASAYNRLVVFAYANNTFAESEMDEPAEGEVMFSNAITSTVVVDGNFTLAFMNSGEYDLYFAVFDENGDFTSFLGSYDDVSVGAGARVEVNLSLDLLN